MVVHIAWPRILYGSLVFSVKPEATLASCYLSSFFQYGDWFPAWTTLCLFIKWAYFYLSPSMTEELYLNGSVLCN